MIKKILFMGSSLGVILPMQWMKMLGWEAYDKVKVSIDVEGNSMTLTGLKKCKKK